MIVLHVPCEQRLNFNSEKWGCYTFLSEFQIRSKWRAKLARHRKGRWCGKFQVLSWALCVSYISHCCDKISDILQCKAGRACSGSQSEHAAHPGREGTVAGAPAQGTSGWVSPPQLANPESSSHTYHDQEDGFPRGDYLFTLDAWILISPKHRT